MGIAVRGDSTVDADVAGGKGVTGRALHGFAPGAEDC